MLPARSFAEYVFTNIVMKQAIQIILNGLRISNFYLCNQLILNVVMSQKSKNMFRIRKLKVCHTLCRNYFENKITLYYKNSNLKLESRFLDSSLHISKICYLKILGLFQLFSESLVFTSEIVIFLHSAKIFHLKI